MVWLALSLLQYGSALSYPERRRKLPHNWIHDQPQQRSIPGFHSFEPLLLGPSVSGLWQENSKESAPGAT